MTPQGKIGRLPRAIREELCIRLDEGQLGPQILPWLNALPEVQAIMARDFEGEPVSAANLSNWRTGGFQEWVKRRARVDRTRELSVLAAKLARAGGATLSDGAAAILSGQLLDALEKLDDLAESAEDGKTDPAARAALFGNLAKAVSALRKGDHEARSLEHDAEKIKLAGETLELARQKFRRETCELFTKWAADERARSIAESPMDNAEKIEQLGQLMFGPDWRTD